MTELGWSEGGGAVTTPRGVWPLLEDIGAELLFEKVLTPCDAASRGRIVLPKKAAVEHFPCQDGKVGLTVQCEDTFGNEHTILHRFWTNAKSRMYLLEGLESVLRVYKVSPGDVLLFGRMPSGKMVVCARLPGPGDVQRTRRAANAVGAAGDKPSKVKQASMPAVATRRQKRARLLERAASVDSESSQEGADYFQPPPDGIFRAVPPGSSYALEPQVLDHGHCWSATANVGGEMYQAFFDTAAGAFDALITAGHNLPDDLAAAAFAYETAQQAAAAEADADAAEADADAGLDDLVASDAGDLDADSEAAEQPDGDDNGAAGSLGADHPALRDSARANSLQAGAAASDPFQHAADEGRVQAAAQCREQLADANAAIDAAAAAGPIAAAADPSAAEMPADSFTAAAAGAQAAQAPASHNLAAAAAPGVELTNESAAAVNTAVSQAASAAPAAQIERQHAAGVAPDLQPVNHHAPLDDAVQEAPASASAAAGNGVR